MLGRMEFYITSYICFGIPASHAFWTLVGSIARVDGISMQPTFNSNPVKNDWVYFSRWNKYKVEPGDVVILLSPKNPRERIIKRVVAVKGLKTFDCPEPRTRFVPQGHIWVKGDNSEKSIDSNHYGPVPLGLVLGKAKWIIWPLDRIQAIGTKSKPCATS